MTREDSMERLALLLSGISIGEAVVDLPRSMNNFLRLQQDGVARKTYTFHPIYGDSALLREDISNMVCGEIITCASNRTYTVGYLMNLEVTNALNVVPSEDARELIRSGVHFRKYVIDNGLLHHAL